jgi:hypothetical protein
MGRGRLIAALATATAVLVAPAPAGALTMKVESDRSAEVVFSGVGCAARDSHRITAPAGAYRLRATLGPAAGDTIESASDFSVVATVRSVRAERVGGRRAMTWTVDGSDAACEPAAGPIAWEAEAVELGVSFLLRRRVPLFALREMRSDARETLSAKFGDAYDQGYAKRLSCTRLGRHKGRCRFSFIIGDGFYEGSFTSERRVRRRAWGEPDRLEIRNRGSARLTDEYCLVTGGRNCVTHQRIRFG